MIHVILYIYTMMYITIRSLFKDDDRAIARKVKKVLSVCLSVCLSYKINSQ